ncbi:EAL domain-containing protein [Bordetella hinzii]|uniref:Cyclic diguanylate phosphodiesterase (EAL) domain protein n=1 Tax=Bordetella hinzii OH87 BAL007II TaxID=1331262 RepID=A0ABR4R2L1_9BORD|nr:EAL domain-containing protein [Bordetella hinzii]KCB24733.1 cyclic diguanylate phosphodiesterase (EAL) domain protein [Bordetella hinzii OH87 BAL007II]QDJ43848.1 EAL domain-containing protein [Bordetella hinzii]QDJ48368.1 EAL domain-containing protein [Bordetella hinzii]QDJ57302.1 EAL domain-containing protein [Bordetella hinzii]
MATPYPAVVTSLIGRAWMRGGDGSLAELRAGSKIPAGVDVMTDAASTIALRAAGIPVVIGASRLVTMSGEVGAPALADPTEACIQQPGKAGSDPLRAMLGDAPARGGASDSGSQRLARLLGTQHEPSHVTRAGAAEEGPGHILVFRQRDQAARQPSRATVNQWLQAAGECVAASLRQPHLQSTLLARLGGADFAVLMPSTTTAQAMLIARQLHADLGKAGIPVNDGRLYRWAPPEGTEALAQAAAPAGQGIADSATAPDGEQGWQKAILAALRTQGFSLQTEVLTTAAGDPVRTEAMLMLQHDAAHIPATLFIPPAIRLGLVSACDRQAIGLGLRWLTDHPGELTIRLALASLRDERFLSELAASLAGHPHLAPRLLLEVDAHGLVACQEEVMALARTAAAYGARIGLRRLAQQFDAVARLHTLPLTYVKLGGCFIDGMSRNPASQRLTASVQRTARALDIEVYAQDVPDEQTRSLLARLGLRVMRDSGLMPALGS